MITSPAITTSPNLSHLHLFSRKAAFFCALAFAFFIPISPALMNLFIFFTLVFVLLSGNLREHWLVAWNNPVAQGGLLLFLLFTLGTLWSIVGIEESLQGLKKYNELWYIALLLPLFHTEKKRELGVHTFLVSMGLILVIVYAIHFGLMPQLHIPINAHHTTVLSVDGGFRTHIITNILMSFAVFIFAQRALLRTGLSKVAYAFLFFTALYYSLFVSTGTTGQILTAGLIALLLIQHLQWKSIIAIPLFFSLIFSYGHLNPNTSLSNAISKIIGGIEHDGGSASERREFITNSIYLIQENPWFGSGTGSIYKRYAQIPKKQIKTSITSNPHNEYTATGLQLGLAGITGLLLLFYTQLKYSRKICNIEQRNLAQGLVFLMVIASLGNSMLMDSGEGHFWAYLTALLFAPIHKQYTKPSNGHN